LQQGQRDVVRDQPQSQPQHNPEADGHWNGHGGQQGQGYFDQDQAPSQSRQPWQPLDDNDQRQPRGDVASDPRHTPQQQDAYGFDPNQQRMNPGEQLSHLQTSVERRDDQFPRHRLPQQSDNFGQRPQNTRADDNIGSGQMLPHVAGAHDEQEQPMPQQQLSQTSYQLAEKSAAFGHFQQERNDDGDDDHNDDQFGTRTMSNGQQTQFEQHLFGAPSLMAQQDEAQHQDRQQQFDDQERQLSPSYLQGTRQQNSVAEFELPQPPQAARSPLGDEEHGDATLEGDNRQKHTWQEWQSDVQSEQLKRWQESRDGELPKEPNDAAGPRPRGTPTFDDASGARAEPRHDPSEGGVVSMNEVASGATHDKAGYAVQRDTENTAGEEASNATHEPKEAHHVSEPQERADLVPQPSYFSEIPEEEERGPLESDAEVGAQDNVSGGRASEELLEVSNACP